MKRIRMLEQYSGPRYDGRSWPTAGTEFEVDDEEAAGLVRQGVAELVKPPKTNQAAKDPDPGEAKPAAARKTAAAK